MSKKSLVFVINAHQPYIRYVNQGDNTKNEMLFSAISDTYLPLLNMFSNLESDGIPFKLVMVFSSVLCSLLSDPVLQIKYIEWLDRSIALGEAELLQHQDDSKILEQIQRTINFARQNRRDFIETYNQNLLSKFSYYAKRGNIELMATAATQCYLPLYSDLRESVCAQIEIGLISHRNYFDLIPEGFWLPHMAYTSGLEQIIKAYGFTYTILDTHGLLFAHPAPEKGVFAPVRTNNSLAVFGRDSTVPALIAQEPDGYMFNSVYRNQDRDIGFELPLHNLDLFLDGDNIRVPTGYKYWTRSGSLYDAAKAAEQVKSDAVRFLQLKSQELSEASVLTNGEDVSLVCAFPDDILGRKWHEGITWLEQFFRQAAQSDEISMAHCSDLVGNRFQLQKLSPFPSSDCGSGYAEDMIDNSNDWMIRYIRKAVERMIDLSVRFPDDSGLKERSLNLAARKVLLAQSGDWPKMVKEQINSEYASAILKDTVAAFTTVYDSLGSNSISTEWLTNTEKQYPIFPWLNYRVFRPKK